MSAGYAYYQPDIDFDFKDIVRRSDTMLYRQKRRKKMAQSTGLDKMLSRMGKQSTEEITDEVILQEKKFQSMSVDELCSVIDLLSPTTDNYPYVVDFRSDFYYIANQALERFCIPKNGFHNVISKHKEFVYAPDYEKLKAEVDDLLETDRCIHSIECRWLDLKKIPIWIHSKGYLVRDDNMKPLYMIGCVNEIGERQKADNVSGLLGESGFREYMNQLDTPLETGYLLRIGIDHFKEINENFGQEYGDFVLKKTAECISGCISEGQKVYKLVADEFLILDVSSDEVKDADKIYDKVREAIDRFIETNEFKVMYTVSGGTVPFMALKGNQCSEALKLTDFALNEAKKLGRNRCYIFNGETYRKFLRKREITQELREAVINGFQGFTAFYQPVFAEDKKVPYGAEALMRFTSEKFGMISPAEFIPILEETGLIIPAGRWMMKEAMGKCSEIRKILSRFRMSINISQIQASKSDVIQDISAEMKRAGLPLEAVIVELTESDLLEQNINEKHFLTELKRMGISLALDDFGTGYSNFHYLSELKPEIIKIDRSFTAKAVADEQEYYLLNQFCTMIHNLDMKICIEGIESAQEWLKIRKLCPEFTQGYFWGKPCGYEEFVRKFVQEK
ncbi:MAG: EAL domain-containing protein [Ruminococcus sp.]